MPAITKSKCPKCGGTGKVETAADVGQHMRILRKSCKVSLRAVAARLGFSAAYVSDLELGRREWSVARMTEFSAAVNLLYRKPKPTK